MIRTIYFKDGTEWVVTNNPATVRDVKILDAYFPDGVDLSLSAKQIMLLSPDIIKVTEALP